VIAGEPVPGTDPDRAKASRRQTVRGTRGRECDRPRTRRTRGREGSSAVPGSP
jgi:hypothetical protein